MPQFEAQFGALSPAAQGLLVSSILIAASITSVVAGPLSDRISRIRTISVGGAVYAAGCAVACSAQHRPQLFIGRCITGIGEGLFISSITVYVTEISPPASRGRLSTCVQLFNTCGVMSGELDRTALRASLNSFQVTSLAMGLSRCPEAFPGASHWHCKL